MNRNQSVLTLCLAFVLGCVAMPITQKYVVRPANAAPEGVKKWEQYCTYKATNHWPNEFGEYGNPANEDMKQRGLEGWELISTAPIAVAQGRTVGLSYCFKRPIGDL
jgi:hypothetical protein